MAIGDRRQKSDSSVNVSMGDINNAQVVTGKNNRVNQVATHLAEGDKSAEQQVYLKAKEELLAAIRENQSEIPDAEDLPDMVSDVDEEIQKEKPNKTKVRALLESLSSQVGKVSGVAVKMTALKAAVSMLLSL